MELDTFLEKCWYDGCEAGLYVQLHKYSTLAAGVLVC